MERLSIDGAGGIVLAADAFGAPDDPPVLFLPTGGQTREFWHGSASALADAGRYAVCLDLRGHGDSGHAADGIYSLNSYIADLRAVLKVLPRAFVVATGLGAIISICVAGESPPDVVSGLALSDPNIFFDPEVYSRLSSALVRRVDGVSNPQELADFIAAAHPGEPRPQLTERYMRAYRLREEGGLEWRGDPRALEGGANLIAQQDRLSDAAKAIKAPVTLIRGTLNDTIPIENVRRLQALIAGSELTEIEGAGHYVAGDREDAFNAILLEFIERKAPRNPIAYIGGSEPRVLRDALGCFGTGVTVVTSVTPAGQPLGFTANSFTSVSLDPPLILFSLARKSANLEPFQAAGKFAVNVLHIGQQPVAERFSRPAEDRFAGVDWAYRVKGGSPILGGSLASFDCTTYAVQDGGDHVIFIGRVEHAWFEPHRDPLLYFRGRYRRLHFN